MSLLTRDNLADAGYRSRLGLPEHLAWTEAQLAQSLADIWAARPADGVWVFGYGSLMWNPLIEFDDRQVATLDGWHRSFCLKSVVGRGQPERPGRMLSLEPGGAVQGLALRLPDALAEAELRLLWTREMTSGSYRPLWAPLRLADGRSATAIVFAANPAHPNHDADVQAEAVARAVAGAVGVFGPNVDYVHALDRSLREHGLSDAYVDAIVQALEVVGVMEAPATVAAPLAPTAEPPDA
jgi:glutathione-specific gamma-glutamylcyclotransferase